MENGGYAEPFHLESVIPPQPPGRVAFMAPNNDNIPMLMAVGYRAHPVLVWNALDLRLIGICDPGIENNGIDAMAFNTNPEIPALVVSYQAGSLCVFDYVHMDLQTLRPHVYAHSIACSPDGRSLVTGSNQGLIEVFDFERGDSGLITLIPIYRSNHPLDQTIRGITFSADGLRFMDIRGRQGRVWAPALLVRKSDSDAEGSVVDSARGEVALPLPQNPTGVVQSFGSPAVTSPLRTTVDGRHVVAGNSGGEVALFSTVDACMVAILYQHARGAAVVDIILAEAQSIIASADASGRILVMELGTPLSRVSSLPMSQRARVVVDRRFRTAVARIIANADISRLLVCGRHVDELWDIPSGKLLFERSHLEFQGTGSSPTAGEDAIQSPSTSSTSVSTGRHNSAASLAIACHSAFSHPTTDKWFILANGDVVRIYAWSDFAEQTSSEGIRLDRASAHGVSTSDIDWQTATVSYFVGPDFITELIQPSASAPPLIYLWHARDLDPVAGALAVHPAPEPNLQAISPAVLQVLGTIGSSTLVFLDTNLWVCSTELRSVVSTPGFTSSVVPSHGGGRGGFRTLGSTSVSPSRPLAPGRSSTLSLGKGISGAPPTVHARRHFFALSEWQAEGTRGRLRCTLATVPITPAGVGGRVVALSGGGGCDVVFATGNHLVVIKGGFGFYENVRASWETPGGDSHALPRIHDGTGEEAPAHGRNSTGGQYTWDVVSGSMDRRVLNR